MHARSRFLNRSERGWSATLIPLLMLAMMLASCGTSTYDEALLEPSGTLLATIVTGGDEGESQILDGSAVAGTLHLTVEVSRPVDEVAFHLDESDAPIAVDRQAPFELVLDTTGLTDGTHVLTAVTPHANGKKTKVEARATFVVSNAAAPEDDTSTADEPTESDVPETGATPEEIDDGAETDDPSDAPATGDDGSGSEEPTTDTPDAEIVFDDPIVITSGGVYSGNWQSLDSSVPAVRVDTAEPVVIENSNIRSAGHLVTAPWSDADLTIRNVRGEALYPTIAGRYPGRFLTAEGYRGIVVENSYMVGTSGIYLNASADGATVKILRNRALNIDGRRADGAGGYDGKHLVQFVQFNAGRNLVDTEVAWNEIVNEPFHSAVEDVVSTYKTTGRVDDPVRIHDNYIQGAYPEDPRTDGYSGGGIMLGDAGGMYLHAYRNTVVATSNYGIAISGGAHNRIYDNTVVSCGLLPDGSRIASQNVGIYVWNMHVDPSFGDNAGFGNRVGWVKDADTRGDWWVPDASEWSDNQRLADVSCEAERVEYDAWLQKTEQVQASIGLTSEN